MYLNNVEVTLLNESNYYNDNTSRYTVNTWPLRERKRENILLEEDFIIVTVKYTWDHLTKDVFIYDRALTTSEIDTLYNKETVARYKYSQYTGSTEVKVYNQFNQANDTLDLTKYVSTIGQSVENIDIRFTRVSPNETNIEFNFDKNGWQNPLLDPITQPEKNYENSVCIKYLTPKYLHSYKITATTNTNNLNKMIKNWHIYGSTILE